MKITIVTTSGEKVEALAERWLLGLVALLSDEDKARLLRLVDGRLEVGHVAGHVITVPGIDSREQFGRF